MEQYPGGGCWQKLLTLNHDERQKRFEKDRERIVAYFFGIDTTKVRRIDHHRCHAAYSYYASPFRDEPVLALTIDGMGDGMNATIGMFDERGAYHRYFHTDQCNIDRIYRYMTCCLVKC